MQELTEQNSTLESAKVSVTADFQSSTVIPSLYWFRNLRTGGSNPWNTTFRSLERGITALCVYTHQQIILALVFKKNTAIKMHVVHDVSYISIWYI